MKKLIGGVNRDCGTMSDTAERLDSAVAYFR